jgi:hypothetical protein
MITPMGSQKERANVGLNKEKNEMEVKASYLYFFGIDIFQFHLGFDVVQPYSHWANFSINIQL